eukprot:8775687-Heterocapsa_arctica.AAC.1
MGPEVAPLPMSFYQACLGCGGPAVGTPGRSGGQQRAGARRPVTALGFVTLTPSAVCRNQKFSRASVSPMRSASKRRRRCRLASFLPRPVGSERKHFGVVVGENGGRRKTCPRPKPPQGPGGKPGSR